MSIIQVLISIPKTIYFNFRYLPIKQAVKLPVWLVYNVKIEIGGGKILLNECLIKLAMVRIGFHRVPVCGSREQTLLNVANNGKLVFKGTAHIGHGSKIYVAEDAQLIIGDNFAISASSQINCYKKIVFGRDIQFSWDCLVMDSDTHSIYDENGTLTNEPREIILGNKIWIGCRSTILKGSIIPDNCVIGACSLISGKQFEANSIIVGIPAKSVKRIKNWEL